ncbi:hypothetical protein Ccrd_018057 [Cynara cardunculus var. scolymus]|uniref:Uncharacterized protein n=1 Tax=Cynara cardunculus var. scolymus TaxID=59895 RepID=A0A103Y6W3_CYNCS|nr:hypothetical protein Ccrd_018057 [Cynara cardunculus var. scolymus]
MALDGIVNVNSLFTLGLFLGLAVNPTDPTYTLVDSSDTACLVPSSTAENLILEDQHPVRVGTNGTSVTTGTLTQSDSTTEGIPNLTCHCWPLPEEALAVKGARPPSTPVVRRS